MLAVRYNLIYYMKHLLNFLSISFFVLLAPFAVYSIIVGFFADSNKEYVSQYSFFTTANADVTGEGEGFGAESACESAAESAQGCEGGGEGK